MFGQPPFGFTSTNFGAFGQQQQQQKGTALVKYHPSCDAEEVVKAGTSQLVNVKHNCITFMKEYKNKSIEELRHEDYVAGRKGKSSSVIGGFQQQTGNIPLFGNTSFGQPATTSAPSVFGGFARQPPSPSSFGNNGQSTNTTGLFGANKPAFRAAPITAFGQPTTTSAPSVFGGFARQPPSPSSFGNNGQSTNTTGLFEANKPAFRAAPITDFGSMTAGAIGTTKTEGRKKLLSRGGGLFGRHQSIFKPTMVENRMETKEVTQKGNLLKAKLIVTSNTQFDTRIHTSPEFVINGVALFQVRVDTSSYISFDNDVNSNSNKVSVRFTKRRDDDDLTYLIYFNSVELNIVGKTFNSDDGTWRLIHENNKKFTFDVTVEMRPQPSASTFAGLHGDTELTDFELCGEDGSVRMHRAVLASASPVLRRMLGGEWRETAEGHVKVTGTSKATLELLKNYVYLHELPESGLEQLLLLSSYYIMPELEQLCVDRLVRDVSAENACDLIEFAAKNNVKRLLLAVLECVQNGAISVSEIRDHLAVSNDAPNTANSTAEQKEE